MTSGLYYNLRYIYSMKFYEALLHKLHLQKKKKERKKRKEKKCDGSDMKDSDPCNSCEI